jgi:hypothetical protein
MMLLIWRSYASAERSYGAIRKQLRLVAPKPPERPPITLDPLGVARIVRRSEIVCEVLADVLDLDASRHLVASNSVDVLLVGLAVAVREAVDRCHDRRRIARTNEFIDRHVGILDRVVQHSCHLLDRIKKSQHDS